MCSADLVVLCSVGLLHTAGALGWGEAGARNLLALTRRHSCFSSDSKKNGGYRPPNTEPLPVYGTQS